MTEPGPEAPKPGTWSAYEPGATTPETSAAPPGRPPLPPTHVPYGPASSTVPTVSLGSSGGVGRWIGIVVAVVAVLAVSGIGSLVAFNGGVDSANPFASKPKPEVLTDSGYQDLVGTLVKSAGTSEVFEAVVYPGYAALEVPVDATSDRYQSYYYDGGLSGTSIKSTTDSARIDLAKLDAAAFLDLIPKVKAMVDDANSWYVIIEHSDRSAGSWFSVYASNEYGETAYIQADREGKVLSRYTSGG